jgi:oligoribonuclease NrnB/cAMP/cGMP phosphodiesterase (DHH superfamily)
MIYLVRHPKWPGALIALFRDHGKNWENMMNYGYVCNSVADEMVSNKIAQYDMTICIYHGNCADGFGAAWVVRKALGDIEFFAGKYQEPPPDVTGKDVVMVDFSYKRPVLLEMAKKANNILILDHHKTSAEDLVDLPANVTVKFDMNRSGAMLAWQHFFPGETPSPLLLHIEDRDLWRFVLPNTRSIQANLFSYPYDFQVWDKLMAAAPETLVQEGNAIERKHFKDIRELLGVMTRELVIGGYRVPVANLPLTMSSDAGHELAKDKPFAACYWDTPKGRVFSLRSCDDGVDVSEVAKQYGGGGHRNAAGFRVSFAQAQAFEVVA